MSKPLSKKKASMLNMALMGAYQIVTALFGFVLPSMILNTYGASLHGYTTTVSNIMSYVALVNAGLAPAAVQALYVEHLPWIEDFKSYQNLTSLNRRVLVELVESITVYDKEHIHIQYRFDQEIRNVLEYCSSVPQAETEESAV